MKNTFYPTPIGNVHPGYYGFEPSDLVFSDSLEEVDSDRFSLYAIHVLCKKGHCNFQMSGSSFRIKEGDFVIWTHGKLVSEISISDDFDVTVLYVSYQFVRKNSPYNDYDIIGNLALLQNPVLTLTAEERAICDNDLKQIAYRLPEITHTFYHELMGCLVVAFFLDLYNIHKRINSKSSVSDQNAFLLRRFVELLETGEYRKNREVAYYASKLFVTPKYLSEVCKKVSGRTATFWIDRFTISEITTLLRNKQLTLTDISEEMNFSSISYFSRYVLRTIGVSPTEYRQSADKRNMT
ncbi:AraC family transcriptional regulator [Pedobacter sp. BMA]|uniref:helix-turn-helix domain-containing protein n=1 Tax=Pedobacter sp. BMA TaxID=1663685 RepID=UPI0009E2C8CC|nr:helix-turn-helix domain-containing protein [Pedobacter sp. BMA]